MKFGGTSVGDAQCIWRAARIIADSARKSGTVAVVSAMGGVTNLLIATAHKAAAGEEEAATDLEAALRRQHAPIIATLITDKTQRHHLATEIDLIIDETVRLCRETVSLGQLTPRALDAMASAGERLSARLLAGALRELGVESLAIDATELIVTNDHYGEAEPEMSETQKRSRACLLPLLSDGVVPVVTGFIGATREGILTTLGRGGSDYSATILGAALDAEEITIWTDVDGVMTADPKLVPEAVTIDEISYDEASALAAFGAKVLHPKTLRPVAAVSIPVWIRNSFAPARRGTRITTAGQPSRKGVKAVTATSDTSLIAATGDGISGRLNTAANPFWTASNDHLSALPKMAVVTVVGVGVRRRPGIVRRIFNALEREGINVLGIEHNASEHYVLFALEASMMRRSLIVMHQEFGLGSEIISYALEQSALVGI
jgi:aspartate kinase